LTRAGIDPWRDLRWLSGGDSKLAVSCSVSAGLIEHEHRCPEPEFLRDDGATTGSR